MKNTIGLLFFGLLFRYGSADVSHLQSSGNNQYLPPPIQNLPIGQDYNGLDSQADDGGGHSDDDRGYLPPYQNQHLNYHEHQHHGGHQHDLHQHDHRQNQDSYDPSVQVSFHNNHAISHPHDQHHSNQAHSDQLQGHHHQHGNHNTHNDRQNDDHVELDEQQLEPVFPSNFPIEAYLPPTAGPRVSSHNGQNHVHSSSGPTRGEGHSISLVRHSHNPVSSPAPFSNPTPVHGGYDYPRPVRPTNLYPNHDNHISHRRPGVPEGNHQTLQAAQQGYLPPIQSHLNHGSSKLHQKPHEDYIPPSQSSHENHGGSVQSPQPLTQLSHDNPSDQDRGYLPPIQSNRINQVNLPRQAQQSPNQDYLPPSQSHNVNQSPHSNHVHHNSIQPEQDYLPPNQVSHDQSVHNQHRPQQLPLPHQDYLPPNQISHGPSEHNQHGHHGYLPPNQINHGSGGNREPITHLNPVDNNVKNVQEPQQDYLPPTDLPSSSGALQEVAPPQLGSLHQQPRSQLTVRGHVNVPLPIPQVGYFFIPGVVSTLPSLTESNQQAGLRPAINIPAIISPQRPLQAQRISSPEYTRAFLLQKAKQEKLEPFKMVITPSIETLQNRLNQNYLPPNQLVNEHQQTEQPQEEQQNLRQILRNAHEIVSHEVSKLHTHVDYNLGSQPNPVNDQQHDHHHHSDHHSQHDHQKPQQIANQGHNAHHHQFPPPDNLSNRGLSLQNIARTEVNGVNNQDSLIRQPQTLNKFQGNKYLPPANEPQNHHHDQPQDLDHQHHVHNQPQNHDHHHDHHHDDHNDQRHQNVNNGYLPPVQPHNHNHITSLQTYMNTVHPNDRYGSRHYQNPPPHEKGNPPPPVATSPPMYSKPAAIQAYAPAMAYRTPINTPFSPSTYLPPVANTVPVGNQNDQINSIGFQLNQEAKRNLASIMPKDNSVFPLEELLDIQDNLDVDVPQTPQIDPARGRIRTVQIINSHSNSVKNFKVLETADHTGVKTIKILGHSNEDPMGEHKVVRIISKGPHPDGILQTVKIFSDHKEVTLPTQNAYLPPPRAKETYVRVLRHSNDPHRSH